MVGLAAAVGIPLGFLIGRFGFAHQMAAPLIALLKPVSPLAWLPIGLLVFKAANPAAIEIEYVVRISASLTMSVWVQRDGVEVLKAMFIEAADADARDSAANSEGSKS